MSDLVNEKNLHRNVILKITVLLNYLKIFIITKSDIHSKFV